MNAREYRAHEALNISKLQLIDKSPLHYKIGEIETTEAMRMGTLIHMAVLEPDLFKAHYVVEPTTIKGKPVNRRLKAHREHLASWRENVAPDSIIVTTEQMELLTGMINSFREELKQKREGLSFGEIMAIKDREVPFLKNMFGRQCKGLLDLVGDTKLGKTVVDFKKVGKRGQASPEEFRRTIGNRHYDAQAYWYKSLAEADAFLWVVVEELPIHKDYPYHAIAIYNAEGFMDIGKAKVNKWLATLEECEKTDLWPCYTNGAQNLFPTDWQIKQYEEENWT